MKISRLFTIGCITLLLSGTSLFCQNTPQGCKFDVASIRPGNSDTLTREYFEGAGSTYRATSVDALLLLNNAFEVKDYQQISGYPKWVSKEIFDIVAKVPEQQAPHHCMDNAATRAAAIKDLLIQRFALRYHIEQRPIQVFALTVIPNRFHLKPVSQAQHTSPDSPMATIASCLQLHCRPSTPRCSVFPRCFPPSRSISLSTAPDLRTTTTSF